MEKQLFKRIKQFASESVKGITVEGTVKGVLSDTDKDNRFIIELKEGEQVLVAMSKDTRYPFTISGHVCWAVNYFPYRPGSDIHLEGVRKSQIKPWNGDVNR